MSQLVVLNHKSPEYIAYQERMTTIEQADFDKKSAKSAYWWAIWEIYEGELYLAGGIDSWEKWTKEFGYEPFGETRSNIWNRITAIKNWKAQGFRANKIKALLGEWNTALGVDMQSWFDKNGEVKPEIAARLKEKGVTVKQAVEETRALSPSQARVHVGNYTNREHIFPTDEVLYDERTGTLYVNVRYESDEDGLIWCGTIQVTATQTGPEVSRKDSGKKFLPETISDWLQKQLRK